jgi:exopolysaccharide biosynthesis polyprenyl glycosylphosphotransferase
MDGARERLERTAREIQVEPGGLRLAAADRATLREVAAPGATRERVLQLTLLSADFVGAAIGSALAAVTTGLAAVPAMQLSLTTVLMWLATAYILGLYVGEPLGSWVSGVNEAPRILLGGLLLSWPLVALAAAIGTPHPVASALVAVGGAALVSVVARAGGRGLLHRSTALWEPTVIVGSGVVAGQLVNKLNSHKELGLDVIGIVDDEIDETRTPPVPILGRLAELPQVLRSRNITRVIFAFSRAPHEQLLQGIRACRDHAVRIDIVPRLFEGLEGAGVVHEVGGLPLLSISVPALTRPSRAAKRLLDVVASLVGLIVLLPLLTAIALAIKLESRGPVFFRQVRCGRSGRRFRVFKFRSMVDGADLGKPALYGVNDLRDGVMFKIREDPRITRVGHFLRRSSLDELPQFINVLRGDMSLVGPRPLIPEENGALSEPWHGRRAELRPGITGPWQIRGRSEIGFAEMVGFDYQYVAGWSLARDLEILFRTLPAVLSRRGAY